LPEILPPPFPSEDFSAIVPYIKSQSLEDLEQRFLKAVKYIESQGIKEYFSIGFCWGVWFAYKMAAKH
jgi:dienelactone hydrolase